MSDFRAYYVSTEAWYARPDMPEGVMVTMAATDGGCKWEFALEQEGAIGLRVKVFSDAWPAFREIPEFFDGLVEIGEDATLAQVRDLLDRLGFRDITQREAPAGYGR